jgi:hypothetical protein
MRELSFLATEQKTGLPVLSVHNSGEEEMRPAIEIPQYPALTTQYALGRTVVLGRFPLQCRGEAPIRVCMAAKHPSVTQATAQFPCLLPRPRINYGELFVESPGRGTYPGISL